ncbi:MAG: hypothetical protein HZA07_05760 [Nitrospirae bacterium]|nr:hypothetical protein [Nitrospirota bacterium]
MSPIGIEVQNQLFTMPNAVTMTSSSGSEVSSWYPEKGHSMFTYFFLKSLKENAEKGDKAAMTAGEEFKKITDEAEKVCHIMQGGFTAGFRHRSSWEMQTG